MPYIITEACIGVKDRACVDVWPSLCTLCAWPMLDRAPVVTAGSSAGVIYQSWWYPHPQWRVGVCAGS